MKPLVSVILPIYNVEPYFPQCMDSLLNQTFRDIEIILVDDGSPDNCPAMCDQYAEQDSRIRVHHQKNAGVSTARNMGLQMAQGDWIMFVDPDDWMELDAIEILYQKAYTTDCDVVIASHFRNYMDCEVDAASGSTDLTWLCPAQEYKQYLFGACFTAPSRNPQLFPENMKHCASNTGPWGKLFNRDFLYRNHILFPNDMTLGEDTMFNLQVCHAAECICFINQRIYHYRMRSNSAVDSLQSDKDKKILTQFERMYNFILGCNMVTGVLPYLQVYIILRILKLIQLYCRSAKSLDDVCQYAQLLQALLQKEGIQNAVQEVKVQNIENRVYQDMFCMLKKRKYRAVIFKYCVLYQKFPQQQKKQTFV